MHWSTRREEGPRSESSGTIQSYVVEPAGKVVRWLGYWLSNNGETTLHFTKRLTLAQGAFWRFLRLSLPDKGLTPYGARRLAKGILLPTVIYRAEFLEPSKNMLNKMQTFWNRISRWITNGFCATNISVLSAAVCLAPMSIYAEQMRLMTAMQVVTAIPEKYIATAMLPQSFPLKREPQLETNRRAAFDMNKGGMRTKV